VAVTPLDTTINDVTGLHEGNLAPATESAYRCMLADHQAGNAATCGTGAALGRIVEGR